jgi:hypothetical protein
MLDLVTSNSIERCIYVGKGYTQILLTVYVDMKHAKVVAKCEKEPSYSVQQTNH